MLHSEASLQTFEAISLSTRNKNRMKLACLTLAFLALCSVISKESRRILNPSSQTSQTNPSSPTSATALPEAPATSIQAPAPALLANTLSQQVVDPMIRKAAQKHRVKAALVKAIVTAESAFNANAVSSKGALGLMQLMPETAQEYGANPLNPAENIEAGTHYLRVLLDRYHRYRNCMSRVIAAYNAGPGMVDKYRGVPPFRETRGYVARVLAYVKQYERDRG
jgi:soluble lytic murein transglycosylase-like protein